MLLFLLVVAHISDGFLYNSDGFTLSEAVTKQINSHGNH